MFKAIKHDFIIEYQRAGDRDWRYFGTARDDGEARRNSKCLKSSSWIARVRIRREVVQSQTIEEWSRQEDSRD